MTKAQAKVAAKWTFSKKSEEAWEVHFDGVYLEVYTKAEFKNKNDLPTGEEESKLKDPPRKFCISPEFKYETQLYNPN